MRIGNKTMEPTKTDQRRSDGVHVSQQAMPKGFQKRTNPKTVRKQQWLETPTWLPHNSTHFVSSLKPKATCPKPQNEV